MSNISNIPISHYKVLSLPSKLEPNSVYYVLDQNSNIVEGYITSKSGVAIPLFNINAGSGKVESVTGTGVTGTATNPKVDIATFISNQLGNLVHLSTMDGKLAVNQITSPDSSIEVTETSTELQIQLSTAIQAEINGKEDLVNKQDSLDFDGTGDKYPTVDAINDALLRDAKVFYGTGITSKKDQFDLEVFDLNTVRIKACDAIIFYDELFETNAVTSDAVKSFAEKIYPLSELITATGGNINTVPIVADGIYVRYIGYDVDGNVISSPDNFVENTAVAQLGLLTVINSAGVISFLGGITPGARNVFPIPILANTTDFTRTSTDNTTDITITYNTGFPTLKTNAGIITGLSINWRGIVNPNNTSSIDKFNYLGDDIVDFVSITPLFLTMSTPPVFHTLWTDSQDGHLINSSFYNTTTSLRGTLDVGSFGIKRILVGLRGGIFVQEPEFATSAGYATMDEAKANVYTHEFTDSIIPPDIVIEIARIIYKKGVTDFSDENEFFIVSTSGAGAGGGGITSVGDATTVSKGIIQLAGDLAGTATAPTVPALATKVSGAGTGTVNYLPKWGSTSGLVNSKIFDDGTNVGINLSTPTSRLHIFSSNVDGLRVQSQNSGYLEVGSLTGSRWRWANDYTSSNRLELIYGAIGATPTTSMLTMTGSGNLLVGTTTDNSIDKLQVNGSANIVSDSKINGLTIGKGGGNVTTNTAIGFQAGFSNTIGSNNTAIGSQALQSGTGSTDSVAIGSQALFVSNGTANSALGVLSMRFNVSGGENTALGTQSLYNITSSSRNTSIGRSSGRYLNDKATSLTDINNSLFIGYRSSSLANSGTNETVIGYDANGLGSNSVVLGNDSVTKTALKGNVLIGTTTDNGVDKLQVNGSANISSDSKINGLTVGKGGGNQSNNTVLGVSALLNNSIGILNTAIGNGALQNNTSLVNTAVGANALNANIGGDSNTALGTSALAGNTSGSQNTGLGVSAGRFLLDGITANSGGVNNIYIGINTKSFAASQNNQIIIGSFANGIGTNSVVLGDDLITKTALKGNVIVGQTGTIVDNGVDKLQVNGTISATNVHSKIETNVQTGTTYTLQNSDLCKQIIFTNSAAIIVIIPSALTVGFSCEVLQQGTGQITFVASATTLKYSSFELPSTQEQYSIVAIDNVPNLTETYHLFGGLTSI